MACKTIDLGGGVTAIACTRGERRKTCSTPGCTGPARKLCDFRVTRRNGKTGTCDRPICDQCATNVGTDRDFCPPHAREEPGVESE